MEELGVTAPLPSPDFWRGRRVLLTGHTGFKGAWAALWLMRLGARVTGFALPPEAEPSLYGLAGVAGDLDSRLGDLRTPQAVAAAVEAADPEIVLHFAAQPLVRRAIADPVETIAVNALGLAHLLAALRDRPTLQRILIVTSDKVYANPERGLPFAEDDRLGGKDPYSASKAAAEMIAHAFAATYFAPRGVALVAARGGNVIGGGDGAADRIVPDVVRAWARGERPRLRMPAATRPWQHVLDCLAGYLIYVEQAGPAVPAALNFGPEPGPATTVAELTKTLLAALGARPEFDVETHPAAQEMKTLSVDSSLARATLGWRSRLSSAAAVRWTADWHSRVRLGETARAVSLDQIDGYGALEGVA